MVVVFIIEILCDIYSCIWIDSVKFTVQDKFCKTTQALFIVVLQINYPSLPSRNLKFGVFAEAVGGLLYMALLSQT